MSTWRQMLAATAVMTLHAMALSTLASGDAHGSTVYRCPTPSGSVSYQAHPCGGGAGGQASRLSLKDTRTAEQRAQALDIRQRDGFDVATADVPSSSRKKGAGKKRQRKRPTASARKAPRISSRSGSPPVALSRHRTGERPFEHVGTPLSDATPTRKAAKPRLRRAARSTDHFTARTPAPSQKAPGR